MYNKLTIVSDTAIYQKDGKHYAFGPVVREIESIEHLFDNITWIGFNRLDKRNDQSMLLVKSDKIKVVLLNKIGGKNLFSIFPILLQYPLMFFILFKNIYNAQVVHTRAPSHPAFIATVLSFFFKKKIWWHKFAGSWNTETLPFFYKFQRNILVHTKHSKITINGFWKNQPKHCYSFENPCLNLTDISRGKEIIKNKNFNDKFTLIFIGRLDESKGVDVIIDSLTKIDLNNIEKIHFIGNSDKLSFFKNKAEFLNDKVEFHGSVDNENVHLLLAKSHFLLLPSKSEGFPKVIAEAACYGTIPIVSNVGSISHYINESNGFLWSENSKITFDDAMNNAFNKEPSNLKKLSFELAILAEKFTFTNYVKKIKLEILN